MEEGDTQKEFAHWSQQFEQQLTYLVDLWGRYKKGAITKERMVEVLDSALERFRYIQQQLIWIEEELKKK